MRVLWNVNRKEHKPGHGTSNMNSIMKSHENVPLEPEELQSGPAFHPHLMIILEHGMKPQENKQTIDSSALEPRFLVVHNMMKMVRKHVSRKHRMESRKEGTENMQINIMINIAYAPYLTLMSGKISNTQGYCYVHINKKMMVDH